MNYFRNEILKVRRSIEAPICFFFALLMIIVTITGILFNDKSGLVSNSQIVFAIMGNFSRYIIMYSIMIIITSMIFAYEFDYGTFRYIMIRPVSLIKLILHKILVAWLYAGGILIIISAFSFTIGTVIFGFGNLYGKDNVLLDLVFVRFLLMFLGCWISTIFIISITMLISIFTKNNVSTIVVTFSILFLVLFFSRFLPENILNLTPINYISIKEYLFEEHINYTKIIFGIFIDFLYSIVVIFSGYLKLRKAKN